MSRLITVARTGRLMQSSGKNTQPPRKGKTKIKPYLNRQDAKTPRETNAD
jgi:hypothetical protein